MHQCNADTSKIDRFITELKQSGDFNSAYEASDAPDEARDFVDFTFQIINSEKAYLQAAIFTFGREDLIPGMFVTLVNDIHNNFPDSISIFKYYLERHIEVDGDHHSHLALQMTSNLCGSNDQLWEAAEKASVESLQKRIKLWDGVYEQLQNKRKIEPSMT
jgi:pyrroloquinoline quinone (PQQ) biosynthesis protein C